MSEHEPPVDAAQTPSTLPEAWTRNGIHSSDWEPLPDRAKLAYRISSLLGFGLPLAGASIALGVVFRDHGALLWAGLVALWLLALVGAWVHGGVRHRRTRYLLDDDGLRIRRGLCWRKETLVPRSRVQHLDLERGPIERWRGLATLVVHTAGTRMNAVNLPGVDVARGRELRNDLVDREAGDDDAV